MQLMEVHNMGLSKFAKKLLGSTGALKMGYRLLTGEQYCPDCHIPLAHRPEGYYECEICNYSITDEEAEEGYGHPTLESTYEDELYNDPETAEYRKPEICKACGGPYPLCSSSCDMFDDEDYNDYDD